MKKLFESYFNLREESGKTPTTVTSHVKLKKDGNSEFTPFTIDKNSHANLKDIVKAFSDSSKVGVGYTTIDKSKGEHEPSLKKKSLYLVGGAVRDHLKGKTPKNYDLVTDATPSEIRMILSEPEVGFVEVKPLSKSENNKYAHLPIAGGKKKVFYASRWDKQGKELEITAEVNGEKFNISTLSKHSKSRNVVPDKAETAASVEEDAVNRDFTMNSLYIPLTNHDGDNADLIDPHGGAHHLKNGEIKVVGTNLASKMDEDPTIAMKYIKMITKFGNPDKMPENHKELIGKHAGLQKLDKDSVRKNYLDGLESPDVDPRKFLGLYHSTGLLKNVFPGVEFDSKTAPQGLRGDRWLSTAWLLRDQEPEKVYDLLNVHGWSKSEANDVAYLVKFYQWATKNNFDPMQFHDMKSTHTGLTKNKIRDWMKMSKAHSPEVDSFLTIDTSDLKPYSQGEYGQRTINPMYQDVLGRSPVGKEFDMVKKFLSSEKWKDSIDKMKKTEDK